MSLNRENSSHYATLCCSSISGNSRPRKQTIAADKENTALVRCLGLRRLQIPAMKIKPPVSPDHLKTNRLKLLGNNHKAIWKDSDGYKTIQTIESLWDHRCQHTTSMKRMYIKGLRTYLWNSKVVENEEALSLNHIEDLDWISTILLIVKSCISSMRQPALEICITSSELFLIWTWGLILKKH